MSGSQFNPGFQNLPPNFYNPYFTPPPQKEQNLFALLSFIFSMVGILIPLFTIPGIILGFISLKQIKEEPEHYTGKGFGIAGIAVGFSILGFYLLIIFFYFMIIFSMLFTLGL
jgi:hypothetical protein